MVSFLAALAAQAISFSPPTPWAVNFAAPGDFCSAGDINRDGYADLVRVSLKGDAFIDVAINRGGMKSLAPQRALSNWGKDCQAACFGDFMNGAGVAGIFDGDTIRIADGFKDGAFKDEPKRITLPRKLRQPHLQFFTSQSGSWSLIAWSQQTGEAFSIRYPGSKDPEIKPDRFERDTVWAGTSNGWVWMDARGRVAEKTWDGRRASKHDLGQMGPGRNPIVWFHGDTGIPAEIFVDKPGSALLGMIPRQLPAGRLPESPAIWSPAGMSGDSQWDFLEFRFGKEAHTGNSVLLYRQVRAQPAAPLASGAAAPAAIPHFDSSGDGLLDEWKVNGFRDLDLKGMGCLPGQKDVVCLISRFSNTNEAVVKSGVEKAVAYYLTLGWHLHPVFLDPVSEADQKRPWWELRDKFIPAKWRGVVHWMQITPWGGGQADQLGDGGGCGGGNEWTLFATFIHEFGHQLGLDHSGYYPAGSCPIYSSLMNYNYSYGFENDIRKVHYSDGALAKFLIRETDLDETLPLPYEKVKFLGDAPYHYRLKANGATTLIDWNWNGIFGEKHVRADINYAYSTTGGRRDEVGKTQCAPWTFTHGKDAYVLYGQQDLKPDGKGDPSVLPDKPGRLLVRRLVKPFQWGKEVKVVESGATGDPNAISFNGEIVLAYPSDKGVAVRWLTAKANDLSTTASAVIDDSGSVPSLGVYKGRLVLFEWNPKDGSVKYRVSSGGHRFGDLVVPSPEGKPLTSTVPVSMAVDTINDDIILGLAQDQDKDRPSRWQIRRFKWQSNELRPLPPAVVRRADEESMEWIEGDKGGARGNHRCVVLFDAKGATGMKGRILYFGLGMTSATSPWSCAYVAQSIADRSVRGGWMVKRYYDEWTQSRSSPAACWLSGDILYAYRWVDGSQGDRDNILHVSYNGTGIESAPMGDFDDIGFIRDFGMRHSILYLRE